MNHHSVPDFEIQMDDEDCPIPTPSSFPRQKKPSVADEEIMELLWQNGQVVMQSQNQRPPPRKPPPPPRTSGYEIPTGPSTAREVPPEVESYNQHLFMQEDEMTSWLHYPIDDPPLDQSFCADFLFNANQICSSSNNNNSNGNSAMQTPARTSQMTELRLPPRMLAPRPPIPPARRSESAKTPNFACFTKHNARAEAAPGPSSSSQAAARESTVVESCDTPVAAAAATSAEPTEGDAGRWSVSGAGAAVSAGGGRAATTCDVTMTSSQGGSSGSEEPVQRAGAAEDRKRKGREAEEWECQSEDADFESAEAKRQARGSTSTKRSRAAEVHNLSERRRRDRITEKMRALQELIPRCNKSDKASMLDEAIEYLKSLQLQVQMMSMGCGMVPMMFPGIQQYMPAMGMGIGMGMGMEMGMNRPIMPFPNMLAGSALPAAAAAHLGPRFPVPPFHMPHVPAPDASRIQAANQFDNMLTSVGASVPNQTRIPNFTDPYQQYPGPHQMQFQLMQNQAMNQPNVNKPSTSTGPDNPENHQPGEK